MTTNRVTAKPEGQTNGDLVTQVTGTVGKKTETFSYERPQNHLFVQNEGAIDIELKVGEETRVLRGNDQFGKELDYTSFTLKALTEDDETAAYTSYATEYGYPGKAKVEEVVVNKPGVTSKKQPKETDVETSSKASTDK